MIVGFRLSLLAEEDVIRIAEEGIAIFGVGDKISKCRCLPVELLTVGGVGWVPGKT